MTSHIEQLEILATNEKEAAVTLLSSALGLPPGTIAISVREAVDHIVNAALLEVTATQSKAMLGASASSVPRHPANGD